MRGGVGGLYGVGLCGVREVVLYFVERSRVVSEFFF